MHDNGGRLVTTPNGMLMGLGGNDRLLHHEEIHSQQWADHGYAGFIATYAHESYDVDIDGDFNPFPIPVPIRRDGCGNAIEEGAGLGDGGYPPCG